MLASIEIAAYIKSYCTAFGRQTFPKERRQASITIPAVNRLNSRRETLTRIGKTPARSMSSIILGATIICRLSLLIPKKISSGSNPLLHTKRNAVFRCEIANYGMLYPSAAALIIKNAYGNHVHQTEIHHGHYTGISVGRVWGYGQSIARNNYITCKHLHHIGESLFLSDMGGIYTPGQSSGAVIRNNVIHDISACGYGGANS
ncbi:MAG: hypothetical protein LBT46_12195 [Planctomycetaceae bacterium]|nr:hypothetical protein [Planctomycetaceae bacterium]